MMTKWKTEKYNNQITRVECTRESEKSVWILERPWRIGGPPVDPVENRRYRRTDFDCYHDTWGAAHAFLLERAENKLAAARRRLQDAQGEYGNVKGMIRPADADLQPTQEAHG